MDATGQERRYGRRAFVGLLGALGASSILGCLQRGEPDSDPPLAMEPKGTRVTRAPTDGDEYLTPDPSTPPPSSSKVDPSAVAKTKALLEANLGGAAYTYAEPGPFPGKERAHIPLVKIQDDGVAVIKVSHVMDSGAPEPTRDDDAGSIEAPGAGEDAGVAEVARPAHWVTTVWAKDDSGRIIFFRELEPTDEPPNFAFLVPPGVKTVRAFAHCNLHGVWSSDAYDV